MTPSKPVWTWAGVVLAVLCAGLAIAHILLTQFEFDTPASSLESSSTVSSTSNLADSSSQGLRANTSYPPNLSRTDKTNDIRSMRATISATDHRPERRNAAGMNPDLPSLVLPAERKTRTSTNAVAGVSHRVQPPRPSPTNGVDDRQVASVLSIHPLGIVEKADGRTQAVIQDGEWTRLVEAGEVLADNSRVLKVSVEGVEILRKPAIAAIEVARDRRPSGKSEGLEVSSASQELPSATSLIDTDALAVQQRPAISKALPANAPSDVDLPGFQSGEATYRSSSIRTPPVSARKRVASVNPMDDRPTESESRPDTNEGPIGSVELPNGRIQSVLADGPWVKLVPADGKEVQVTADNSQLAAVPPPPIVESAFPPLTASWTNNILPVDRSEYAAKAPIGPIQDLEFTGPDSREPIGIVEWPDGRRNAVVIESNEVTLATDDRTVELTRRTLARMWPPLGNGIDPASLADSQPGWPREDEMAGLMPPSDDSSSRGPPEEPFKSPPAPDETARGQPEDAERADLSRSPPQGIRSGFDRAEDGLPGIEASSAARMEPLQSIRDLPSNLLSNAQRSISGSVSKIPPKMAENGASSHLSEIGDGLLAETEPETARRTPPETFPDVLGLIRFADGSERSIVNDGQSVVLLDASDLENLASQPNGAGRVAPAEKSKTSGASLTSTGGNHTGGVQSPQMSRVGILQSKQRIRDNQGQSRQ